MSWHATSDIFKIKNKFLIISTFFIRHLTEMTILTHGLKIEDKFDIIERLWTNLRQMPKVEDQNDI